jgi:hypothetical protein
MKKTNTLLDETIHITPECNVHLHGHQNKMVPLMKPSIFVMTLSYAIAHVGQLMTFKATVFRVRAVTITSATKVWSFQIM